ncbi:MAG: nitrate- and nitrite sensing domain-containing protein [Magnetococcales bacterium]|nr:nitrate- and nitrite sensing domain-containing protein [Magnetococcales bacterium]
MLGDFARRLPFNWLLVLLLPLWLAVWYGGWKIMAGQESKQQMEKILGLTELANDLGTLVHTLQKERGLSMGFMGSHGNQFQQALATQRAQSDQQLTRMQPQWQVVEQQPADAPLAKNSAFARSLLQHLAEIRLYVDQPQQAWLPVFHYYSNLNRSLLHNIAAIARLAEGSAADDLAAAYVQIVTLKELAGQERALITAALTDSGMTPEILRRAIILDAEQEANASRFGQLAPRLNQQLQQRLQEVDAEEMNRLRERVVNLSQWQQGGERLPVDAEHWFHSATNRIEVLRESEEQSAAALRTQVDQLADSARQSFWLSLLATVLATLAASSLALLMFWQTRRAHWEQIQLLMRYTPHAMALFDRNMHYLQASHRWMEEHNLDPEQTLGRSHYQLLPNQAPRWREIYQTGFQDRWARQEAEFFPGEGGKADQWFTWEVRPWRTASHHAGGIILFVENVTERVNMQEQLRKQRDKLAYERHFIENVILRMRQAVSFHPGRLNYILSPVERTAGDLLLSALHPQGCQYIMLGDFTGHGLLAAMGGPIVSDIFYTMTSKGFALSEIIVEINRKLQQKMPVGMFMAAIFLEWHQHEHRATVWNMSMPDVLCYRHATQQWQRIPSHHLACGILANQPLRATLLPFQPHDRLYFTSDGVVEAEHPEAGPLGIDSLQDILHHIVLRQEPLQVAETIVKAYLNKNEQADDISLVEMICPTD